MTGINNNLSPAKQLTNVQLEGGWKVVERFERDPATDTGGTFSVGYRVQNAAGKTAFLKALDFISALGAPDPAQEIQEMAAGFLFERVVCDECVAKSLDRIVSAISHGRVQIDPLIPQTAVQYIIFELADGDIRRHLDRLSRFDVAWALRALHHVSVGLNQLHSNDMAHQDLKPSNVLVFKEDGAKLADLGRAASKRVASPFDSRSVAGALAYAPPDLLYRFVSPEWNERRCGCDLYHLGSMIAFMFGRVTMTGKLFSHLAAEHHFAVWPGTYDDVLPYLIHAFDKTLQEIRPELPEFCRAELLELTRYLCHPDPRKRGHPLSHTGTGNAQSLTRFVSALNLFASKAESKR